MEVHSNGAFPNCFEPRYEGEAKYTKPRFHNEVQSNSEVAYSRMFQSGLKSDSDSKARGTSHLRMYTVQKCTLSLPLWIWVRHVGQSCLAFSCDIMLTELLITAIGHLVISIIRGYKEVC